MTTVEDILSAKRPNLRERANEAARIKAENDRAEKESRLAQLRKDTYDFLRDTLGMSGAELNDLELHSVPTSTRPGPSLYFKIDDIEFDARYTQTKVMDVKYSQFNDEAIYDDELVVEVRVAGPTPKRIRSLEELGAIPSV
jgi:hypothetical protein